MMKKETKMNNVNKETSIENTSDILNNIQHMVLNVDDEIKLKGLIRLRKMNSSEAPGPIDDIITSGLHKVVIELLLNSTSNNVRYESCWILINILATGSSSDCNTLFKSGVLKAVIKTIQTTMKSSPNLCGMAVWALANFLGNLSCTKQLSYKQKWYIFRILVQIMHSANCPQFARDVTRSMRNMLNAGNIHNMTYVIMIFKKFLAAQDYQVLYYVVNALYKISSKSKTSTQIMISMGIHKYMMKILQYNGINLKIGLRYNALRVLSNMVMYTNAQTHTILMLDGFFDIIKTFLHHSKIRIRTETLFMLSNMCTGPVQQIDMILTSGIFKGIKDYVYNEKNQLCKYQVIFALANILSNGTLRHINNFISYGIMDVFYDAKNDPKMSAIVSSGLDGLFMKCNMLVFDPISWMGTNEENDMEYTMTDIMKTLKYVKRTKGYCKSIVGKNINSWMIRKITTYPHEEKYMVAYIGFHSCLALSKTIKICSNEQVNG